MKIIRFNTISSLPAVMKTEEYTIPDKVFDKSIVDKSCYTPIADAVAKVQPMTTSEINQHFDFVNGKDDGRKSPPRQGQDIAEVHEAVKKADERLKKQIKDESERIKKEREQKALVDSIMNPQN